MAEQNDNGAAQPQQQFAIQRLYLKDLSFEAPNTPQVFVGEWKPESNIELNTSATPLGEENYEVVVSITVTTKVGEKTAYLVEVQQAGIFTLTGFSDADREAMLGSYCPNVLFPYVREVVSNLVAKGSFPQLVLQPINFDALYAQHLEKRQQEGAEPAAQQ